MKKLLLLLLISFLFNQKSIAQCDPVLTINENFGFGLPACWTQPNGNTAIDNNNGWFGGHPTHGAIIVLREVANLTGTLVLQVRTRTNQNSSFHVDRIQNGTLVSQQIIHTTPSWQNATLNFTGFSGRGYIRIRQYTANAPAIYLANVSYTSTCPAVQEVIFRTNDLTVQLDASGNANITPAQVDLGSNTTCGAAIANFSFDVSTFTCANLGSNTVNLSAEDGSGNVIGTTPITITVVDLIAPTVIGQNIAVQANGDGNATITPAMLDNGSFDGCGGALTLSISKTTFVCGETGDITVTLTAEDPSGNAASTDVTVTVTSSIINDQALTATNSDFCPDGVTSYPAATISTASSQVGFDYILRKSSDNSIIDGPKAGTGSSLNFNTGSLTQTTTFNVFANDAGPVINSALDFDGVDDYMHMSTNASFDYENGYTIETWVKVALPVNDNRPIFSIGASAQSDIEIYIQNTTDQLIIVHNRNTIGTAIGGYAVFSTPPNNQWFHLAVTYNGSNVVKVYIDGVVQSASTDTFASSTPLTKTAGMLMKVGRIEHAAFPSGGANFKGQMDELRLWTGARTAGEILGDKDNCLTGTETNLEYYFNLDDNSGLIATDLVNGTDGTLANMDASSDWVASGTGFACAICGFEMLTEIKVGDATPPTAVAQNIVVQIDAGTGLATITPAMLDNGSSDNCGGAVTLSLSKTEFGCGDVGANAITLIVEDATGNQSTANATVTVTSSINDETVTSSAANFCSGGGSVDITTSSSVNGVNYYLRNNADDAVIAGPVVGTGSGLTFNSGNLTATTTFNVYGELIYTASGGSQSALDFDGVDDYVDLGTGNRTIATQLTIETWIKTTSNVAKLFVSKYTGAMGYYLQLDASGKAFIRGRDGVGSRDSGVSTTSVNDGQWHYVVGTINVTTGKWRIYIDGVDESATPNQGTGVSLASTSDFLIGANSINYASADVTFDKAVIWNRELSAAEIAANVNGCLTETEIGVVGYFNFDEAAGAAVTDLSGNGNGTLENMDPGTDWISAGVNMSCLVVKCGFEMSNTVTVSVGDVVNPTAITQDITVQLSSDGGATITAADINNGSTDNCTAQGSLVFSLDKIAFTCADLGAYTVTLTVEDATLNIGTAIATVTVVDGIAPNAVAQNITVQLDASGNAAITTAAINNGSTDNCTAQGSLVFSLDKTALTCADLGANTVILTVADASGNQNTATATVTVVDGIVPTPISQNITVQLDATGNVTITAADVNNGSLDNCSSGASLLLSLSQSTFDCTNLGANNITFTVEDASGNQFSTGATITVEDVLAPTVTTRNITVNLDNSGNATITPVQINNGSSDNCTASGDLVLSLDKTSFVLANVGANTVTLTVIDANGNTGTATATVTIQDKTNQTITFATLANKMYGDADFIISATSDSGLPVSFALISGPATISGSDVSITGVGEVVIEASQVGDATFGVASTVQQSFTVAQVALTVTADDQSIIYGESIPTLTYSYSGFIPNENATVLITTPSITTTANSHSDAGTYSIILAGATADNYAITLVDGSLVITKADQTVTLATIANQDITQVTTVEVTSATSSGLATTLTVTGPASISGTTITLTGAVGTVTVTANQAGNFNYNTASDVTSFEAFDSTDPCLGFAVTLNSITDNMCNGGLDGVINIGVTGGDGHYSYDWSNDTASEDATNLAAGTYTVTVTDGNNCTVTLTETVNEPTLIEITATTTDVVVGNDGAADITVTGGTGAYTFSWSNGANTEDITNVTAGTYTVTVTDANGCSVTQTVEVGDIITAVEDVNATTMQIYPNPVSDFVKVEGVFANAKVEVQLINSLGVQVLIKRFENVSSNTVELPVTELKNGHYLVVVTANNNQTVQRINIKH